MHDVTEFSVNRESWKALLTASTGGGCTMNDMTAAEQVYGLLLKPPPFKDSHPSPFGTCAM